MVVMVVPSLVWVWIDRAVMGRFRDSAGVKDGVVVFAEGYYYTWILSSLNFVVTVMSGLN